MRTIVRAAVCAIATALPLLVAAQAYPAKPLRLVVPFPPGGATDVVARVVATRMQETIGQPIVVENRVGAGGVVGTDAVAKAPADGYTLLAVFDNFTTNPHLFKNVQSDPVRDFAPLGQLVRSYQLLLVPSSLGPRTIAEFLALARTKGTAMNYATAGPGTSSHLAMELLKMTTNIDPTAIHYKGGNPAIAAIVGGQVDVMIVTHGIGLPHVRSGKLTALAVTSPGRHRDLPEVSAIAQQFPGFETQSWVGFMAPAGTPREIVMKLNGEINAALVHADTRQRLEGQGYEVVGGAPEPFGELVKTELARWGRVIRERRITLE